MEYKKLCNMLDMCYCDTNIIYKYAPIRILKTACILDTCSHCIWHCVRDVLMIYYDV